MESVKDPLNLVSKVDGVFSNRVSSASVSQPRTMAKFYIVLGILLANNLNKVYHWGFSQMACSSLEKHGQSIGDNFI